MSSASINKNSELNRYIRLYTSLGFCIIPISYREKIPAIPSWKEYQTRKPTDEEIESWFNKQSNIAIVTGVVSGNLVVLDFDSQEAFEKFFPNHDKLVAETFVIKTGKGVHVYFRCLKRTPNFKILELSLDIKSDGGYVVAPPSIHPNGSTYQLLGPNVNAIKEVDDIEEVIWRRAEQLGVKRSRLPLPEEDDRRRPEPPCIAKILEGVPEGIRDESAIRLASYFLWWKRYDREHAWIRLWNWNEKNSPPLPERQLRKILHSALRGYEYGCNGMREIQFCTPEMEKVCSLKDTLKIQRITIVHTPSVELPDGRLAEQGYDPNSNPKVFYIVYDPKTGTLSKSECLKTEDMEFYPIFNRDVETFQVVFPTTAIDYGLEAGLIDETVSFLNRWHYQPDELERILDALAILVSWIADVLPRVAYRRVLAEWGKGKSAFLEVMGAIVRRAIFLAGCDTDAAIRRTLDLWRGTAIIDEGDFTKSDVYSAIVKILNIGYDAKLGWYRCCNDKDASVVDSFYVYGLKVIATRRRWRDMALESRCHTFIGTESRISTPLFRLQKFAEEALQLRNKLLMWRFRHYHDLKKKVADVETVEFVKEIYGDSIDISSRIKETTLPLVLVGGKDLQDKIIKFARDYSQQLESLDEDKQLEAQIWRALEELVMLVELVNIGAPQKIRLKDIARKILGDEPGKEDKEAKREYVNAVKSLNWRIARYFRDHTQLELKTGSGNLKEVIIPAGELKAIKQKSTGGYHKPLTPLTPLTNATTFSQPEELETPKQTLNELGSGIKYICGYCWTQRGYNQLAAIGSVENTGQVLEGNCTDCGRPATSDSPLLRVKIKEAS